MLLYIQTENYAQTAPQTKFEAAFHFYVICLFKFKAGSFIKLQTYQGLLYRLMVLLFVERTAMLDLVEKK